MPANPQTAEEHLVAAQSLYAQRRYDEAARHLERALELLRGEARASTIEEAQAAVVNPGEPIRVGGSIREPRKIRHVPPVYPPEALAANVQGVVILEAVIATDGSVTDLKLLRSIPLLDQAAVDAVRQWLFTPTMLNGKPVEVAVTITVNFAR
jgi:TonB family protein